MGKRKSRSKAAPKKKMPKLDTTFTCPFCNIKDSVECDIDKKEMTADAGCTTCKASFSMRATNLTEPVDVYHEWLDECERANERIDECERANQRIVECERANEREVKAED